MSGGLTWPFSVPHWHCSGWFIRLHHVGSLCRLTFRMIRREAVGIDAVVSGHVREIASSRVAARDAQPQR
jgi:hypothetical protein